MLSLVNDAETELLQFFCNYPTTPFSISKIAEKNDLSRPWVAEKVEKFRKEGLVEVEKKGNMKEVAFNRDREESKRAKRVINLEAIYSSGIVDRIVEEFSYPEAVVLFGSFAKGEDTEKSDIDIAVLSRTEGDIDMNIMGREVSVKAFDPADIPRNMLESLANGIVLYGYLEVKG